ncbi:unnamed protein product [Closterium sp. NIES-53]
MALRPSSVPLRVPLPSPPASSLADNPEPESDLVRAASPTFAELVEFVDACCLDYAASLVAESRSNCAPSVGGECALGTDVLDERQEEFECFASGVPHIVSMLLAHEGDSDAPDIPTLRSYIEVITSVASMDSGDYVSGDYSSQWQTAMDAEKASWKSTGTYVNAVPPPEASIVDGMWIFRVKRPPGSRPVFKVRYVAQGFSHRQGVDFFQTSPTTKMTPLEVLLRVTAQRDYELHSLDFSTPFLQGSLHKEIWLRRPSGFTRSFPAGTQWSLRRPVYGLRQAPHEWHNHTWMFRAVLKAANHPPPLVEPLEISSDSSGPIEGGDPAAVNTAATRRSPRLETPPGFPPRSSSPPLQPAAVDSGAETAGAEPGDAETEGKGSRGAATGGAATGGAGSRGAATGGAGSWGAATGGADSGGPASPSVGGAVGDPARGPGAGQPQQPDLLETLSLQAIRAWIVRRGSPGGGRYGPAGAGAASPGGTDGAGGTGGTAGAGGTGGTAGGAGGAGGAAGNGGTGGAAGARGAGAMKLKTQCRGKC